MSTGPMDCNELVELVTAYLDESLDLETRPRFDLHLLECDGCQNYLEAVPRHRTHRRKDQPRASRPGLPCPPPRRVSRLALTRVLMHD